MRLNKSPILHVYAGPNGSGKSFYTQRYDDTPERYINADDIQKELGLTVLEAAREADRLRRENLEKGITFAFETVFSRPNRLEFLKEAKERGYEVHVVYVITQDVEINIGRVAQRVHKGGHGVPEDKIRSRYERALSLIKYVIPVADQVRIFNNSLEEPIIIFEKTLRGEHRVYPRSGQSLWSKEKILELIGLSREQVEIINSEAKAP